MILLSEGAQYDLIEAAAKYGRIGGISLAKKFKTAVQDKLQQIERFPEAYPLRVNKYRVVYLSNFPYTIYYTAENTNIYVSAILFNNLPPRVILQKLK